MLYVLSKCWLLSLYLVHTKYILTKFGWTKYGTDQIWLDQIWHRPNLVGPKMAPTKYGFGPNMGWTKYGPDQICWTKFGPTKNGRPKVSRPNLAWHRWGLGFSWLETKPNSPQNMFTDVEILLNIPMKHTRALTSNRRWLIVFILYATTLFTKLFLLNFS